MIEKLSLYRKPTRLMYKVPLFKWNIHLFDTCLYDATVEITKHMVTILQVAGGYKEFR